MALGDNSPHTMTGVAGARGIQSQQTSGHLDEHSERVTKTVHGDMEQKDFFGGEAIAADEVADGGASDAKREFGQVTASRQKFPGFRKSKLYIGGAILGLVAAFLWALHYTGTLPKLKFGFLKKGGGGPLEGN